MAEIFVVIEHRKRTLADVSLQMLSKGRQLADQTGDELLAVIIGRDVRGYGEKLATWADRVMVVRNDKAEESLAEPCQKILTSIIKERKPKLVIIGHSSFGMELAPALAVAVDAPLATDCIDITIENGAISVTRSFYNGKVNAIFSLSQADVAIVTGRVGEFIEEEYNKQGKIEEIDFSLDEEFNYKQFHGYLEQKSAGVDITKSDILVSVGRGIKEKENIKIAESLAEALGGVVSCSRPVVDSGWLPAERQVGLSGNTVKPKLYLAIGISGAFQHMVGMKGSRIIVAINKDARAPIFSIADYGIVDDALKVLPELTKKIAELEG
ncbi:MAG: electron transfer flavoprotein subunit alpha/FixB family protein [Dehalococcoidales bacterium]|nr:electron transfer flavoprotein subunit alpha/FixB family protein [Dehalococcoidales bacterium]